MLRVRGGLNDDIILMVFQAAKAIYMGPDAALEGDGYHKGKPGNASIIGMTSFTPRTIAGVVTQVCIRLLMLLRLSFILRSVLRYHPSKTGARETENSITKLSFGWSTISCLRIRIWPTTSSAFGTGMCFPRIAFHAS